MLSSFKTPFRIEPFPNQAGLRNLSLLFLPLIVVVELMVIALPFSLYLLWSLRIPEASNLSNYFHSLKVFTEA